MWMHVSRRLATNRARIVSITATRPRIRLGCQTEPEVGRRRKLDRTLPGRYDSASTPVDLMAKRDKMMASGPLFLEDLAVGQRFRTGTITIELDRVKEFATAFDPQPFHLDETAGSSSIFGGLVASGWHTAALTMRLMVESDLKIAGGLIGVGVEQIRWPRPVRPGDQIHVDVEVLEVRPSNSNPTRGVVRFRSRTWNQYDELVMEQVATLVVPRATS